MFYDMRVQQISLQHQKLFLQISGFMGKWDNVLTLQIIQSVHNINNSYKIRLHSMSIEKDTLESARKIGQVRGMWSQQPPECPRWQSPLDPPPPKICTTVSGQLASAITLHFPVKNRMKSGSTTIALRMGQNLNWTRWCHVEEQKKKPPTTTQQQPHPHLLASVEKKVCLEYPRLEFLEFSDFSSLHEDLGLIQKTEGLRGRRLTGEAVHTHTHLTERETPILCYLLAPSFILCVISHLHNA